MHTVNQSCPCRSFNLHACVSGNILESSKKAFQCLPLLGVHMANASEITELSLFKAKPIPCVFRILSRSLTKTREVTGGAKAEQSQENESILQDRKLSGQIKRHSQCITRNGKRLTCPLLLEMRIGSIYDDGFY